MIELFRVVFEVLKGSDGTCLPLLSASVPSVNSSFELSVPAPKTFLNLESLNLLALVGLWYRFHYPQTVSAKGEEEGSVKKC